MDYNKFQTVQTENGPQVTEQMLKTIVRVTDDFYDFSVIHSKRKKIDRIACERSNFIGYLCEAVHYAMNDIHGYASSFYKTCKENDDNIIGKHVIKKPHVIVVNFNLFNSLGLNIPYAAQRASDFCWEVFSDIKVTPMEKHLWNIQLEFDTDLIRDQLEKVGEIF